MKTHVEDNNYNNCIAVVVVVVVVMYCFLHDLNKLHTYYY